MTEEEQRTFESAFSDRIDVALRELHNNPAYRARCKKQEKSEEIVESLYDKLDEDEREKIRRHYEGEIDKENFELDESYIQGMRDCIHFLEFLDAFHYEMKLDE